MSRGDWRGVAQGLVLGIVCAGAQAAQPAAGPRPVLELREEAVVAHAEVQLGELAVLRGLPEEEVRRMMSLPIAPAPRLGQMATLGQRQVLRILHDRSNLAWTAAGAPAVKVRRATQDLPWASLCEAASASFQPRLADLPFGAQSELRCNSDKLPPMQLPAGAVDLRVRDADAPVADGMQDRAVDVLVDGRLERTVRVMFQLSLQAPQWCARSAQPAGAAIDAATFATCMAPVRRPEQLAGVGQPMPVGRLKRALRAGEPLKADDIVSLDAALSGEAVTVRYRAGSLELQSPGVLARDAKPGEQAWVRLPQGGQPVAGRLVAAHVVEMEVQP